jgi:hypothetical protein
VKLGAENRVKLIVAIVLMAIAGLALLLNSGNSTPSAAAPASTATPGAASQPPTSPRPVSRTKVRGKKASTGPRSLDPSLRYDWLKASEDTKYEGTGRNIFLAQAEIPKPIETGAMDKKKQDEGPPQPPPPPPINLKFFGFASKPGESKKIFLSEGEDVFIAAEGEVVNRHYKVLRISPTSVEIEDVLNNNRQSIPLTAG